MSHIPIRKVAVIVKNDSDGSVAATNEIAVWAAKIIAAAPTTARPLLREA